MSRALAVGIVLVLALGVWAWRVGVGSWSAPGALGAPGARLPEYWPVPEFEFEDQHGRRMSPRELAGSVWIADFIFTQCTSICPTMSGQFVRLQRELALPELRFVSFSVDPAHDTPAVLASYAERWSPGETRWHLLATEPESLARTAEAIGVIVAPSGDPEDPILHSNRFFLIDAQGVVRGLYSSDDEEALRALVDDARALLAGSAATAAREELDGARLYARYGCAACHADPKLAPPLEGLAGREVALEDGTTRRADAEYVRRALVAPAEELARGYRATMPAYGGVLSAAELERLVAHVGALATTTSSANGAAPFDAVDPVCGMHVTVVADTPSAEHAAQRFYFCAPRCRDAFVASPVEYARD